MTSINDHLTAAEKHIADLDQHAMPDQYELARLHIDLAAARIGEKRLIWLGLLDAEIAEQLRADLRDCALHLDGSEDHPADTCPDTRREDTP